MFDHPAALWLLILAPLVAYPAIVAIVRGARIAGAASLVCRLALLAVLVALLAGLQIQVSLEQVLRLVFERRGARMETPSQVVYWVNSAGLSLSKRRLLGEIVEGLCAMGLQEQGKPIHLRLKDMPP